MSKFKLYWLDKTEEITEGNTISDAFSKAGYGAGALRGLDYYEEIIESDEDIDNLLSSVNLDEVEDSHLSDLIYNTDLDSIE